MKFPARLIVAVACVGSATFASSSPLKVGLIETLSGPQASTGLLYRTAAKYTFDRLNATGGWNGEPIQMVEYDNQGGTSGAADKFKAAVADGVQVVISGASSAVSGQLTEDVRKHNLRNPGSEILFLNVGAEGMELTGAKCNYYHFRTTSNVDVRMKALVAAMKQANVLGTRVYSINQNYSAGVDGEKAIVGNSAAGGYTVVEKTLHDVNKIQDFAPYVAKIGAANVDTVLTINWSNDLLLLMKAAKSAGLKVRFGTYFLDQPGAIANAGEAALGNYVVHLFNAEAGGAEGVAFAEDYKNKTGHYPAFVEAPAVYGVTMFGEALKGVKPVAGKLSVAELAKVMEKTKIRTPIGELSMRAADHQAVLPLVVSVISKDAKYKADGTELGLKPMMVISAVDASVPPQPSCQMQRP